MSTLAKRAAIVPATEPKLFTATEASVHRWLLAQDTAMRPQLFADAERKRRALSRLKAQAVTSARATGPRWSA